MINSLKNCLRKRKQQKNQIQKKTQKIIMEHLKVNSRLVSKILLIQNNDGLLQDYWIRKILTYIFIKKQIKKRDKQMTFRNIIEKNQKEQKLIEQLKKSNKDLFCNYFGSSQPQYDDEKVMTNKINERNHDKSNMAFNNIQFLFMDCNVFMNFLNIEYIFIQLLNFSIVITNHTLMIEINKKDDNNQIILKILKHIQ
ncbi:unnamed protein product [Paramecium pentaurelia]|uniref:Uncharacterized protein n=1 Tax=Paramecium pentaurelia TaxID=43138 RepID=A0A8S1TLG5_9CILI|nr:unnamed protein product [Paramecium pentaurelia]